jgi:hypothetical protein
LRATQAFQLLECLFVQLRSRGARGRKSAAAP